MAGKDLQSENKIILNEEFNSSEEFKKSLNAYQQKTKALFCISSSRLLKNIAIQGINKECKYMYVKLVCKFGPLRHSPRGTASRNTR